MKAFRAGSVISIVVASLMIFQFSCRQKESHWQSVDFSKTFKPEVVILRYELDLFQIPTNKLEEGLAGLAPRYPLFIGSDYGSEQALIQMKAYLSDPVIRDGFDAVEKTFTDMSGCEVELSKAFQRLQVAIPEFRVPQVFTYVSGFDTQTGVFVNDSVVIIPLDLFLGSGFEAYNQLKIPAYIQRNMTPEDVVPEVIRQILFFYFWKDVTQKPLVDQMIEAGKIQALLEFVLPQAKPWSLFRYTKEQLDWCSMNETHIWAMLIEKDYLFSSDPAVVRTIMSDGPFTSGLDKSSPSRIGEWVGYQIVSSFLEKNTGVMPSQLFKMPEGQEFLRQSAYKPRNR
ncbi:MAG: hypothetical protein PHQ65_03615 [Bacteroidales bacterium]|nr:hypothetical protein [Bacteroidales bacterium]MDD3664329.1 hypothetical protein [Bacteroidales bacterium]